MGQLKLEGILKDHLGNTRMTITDDNNAVSPLIDVTSYYPFGLSMKVIGKEGAGGLQNKFKYNGKEEQRKEFSDGSGLDYLDYGARMYDAQIGRWYTIDPLSDSSRRWSPFVYGENNPIRNVDIDGMYSDFYDEAGTKISHVEDGSNAVFTQTAKGATQHYELTGFDTKQGGIDKVTGAAISSVVEAQQNLNNINPALQQNAMGLGETHCNDATQNVLKSVGSALGDKSINLPGLANDMMSTLEKGININFKQVDERMAEANAAKGGVSIAGVKEGEHGHVLTYSVGSNIQKGMVANIGTKRYTGFTSLNGAINKNKRREFFILKIY